MYSPSLSVVLAVAAVLLAGWYLSFSATRLDRLHARVEGARSALDAQLVRRASVALQLAASGLLDPATASCSPTPRTRPGRPTARVTGTSSRRPARWPRAT